MEDRFIPQPGSSLFLGALLFDIFSRRHRIKRPDSDVAAPIDARGSTSTSRQAPPSATTDSDSDNSDNDMHDNDHDDDDAHAQQGFGVPSSSTTTTSALNAPMRKRKPKPMLPPGTIICDKSCIRCRERKGDVLQFEYTLEVSGLTLTLSRLRKFSVKCDRRFPTCHHCAQRKEECDLIRWTPKVKKGRIAHLEKRLAELEDQLAAKTESFINPVDASFAVDGTPFDSSFHALFGLPASSPSALAALSTANSSGMLTGLPLATDTSSIGAFSLDWRLATPQMAAALSRHLCDGESIIASPYVCSQLTRTSDAQAFFESCCFLLPTYTYFRSRKAELQMDERLLSPSAKVAVAAFRAVGARTSPHSALLGILIEAKDSRDHPDAPLLSAGTRRESACTNFLKQAHQLCFDEGLAEEASIENVGSLMTLMQMAMFVELKPKKSRSLLRSALDQYKQLIDAAPTDVDKNEVKKTFGFGLYSADAQIAAFGRRLPCIDDHDLRAYFSHIGIVIPALPEDDNLIPVLEKLLAKARERPEALKTIRHLLHCWICTSQRDFARLASPPFKPFKPEAQIEMMVRKLWLSIDKTRSTIQHVLSALTTRNLAPLPHSHSMNAEHRHHHHETDYGPLIIRLDRDLLDLNNMLRSTLLDWSDSIPNSLIAESTSRVRKGLKILAYYAKVYMTGADLHMVYHQFYNLELVQDWTTLAQQRVGDALGPTSSDEVVTEQEKEWLIEGLKMTCYYHPFAERRLAEIMTSRLVPIEGNPSLLLGEIPLAGPTGLLVSSNQADLVFSIDALLNGDPFAGGTSLFDTNNTFNTDAIINFGP
ncbi:BQ2448_2784 [Microbotryum intermedium]|uniref:BQ2448_2784 protein n=1 Tax=Microbotryum intermedium TaxID=269621 RepID=A0A238FJE3_9BASI|nr:BQ2448_2784 [Microbotryum intermedium]